MENSNKSDAYYGTVIILDALGMKGIWKKEKPTEIIENWQNLVHSIQYDQKLAKKLGLFFTYSAFSDTLIMTISGKISENDTKIKILKESSRMLSEFIEYGIDKKMYFRGSISIGWFYANLGKISEDKRYFPIILGPAIDEAAEYYEQGDWLGIIATPSVESILIREESKGKTVEEFCRYEIPIKNSKPKKGWTIAFGETLRRDGQMLINKIHKKLEESEDPSGSIKWKNTLDFLYYLKTQTHTTS